MAQSPTGVAVAVDSQPGIHSGDVIALDARKQKARAKGPRRTIDLIVKDPGQFELIKVGDQVVGTFVEASALSVEPAARKAVPRKQGFARRAMPDPEPGVAC